MCAPAATAGSKVAEDELAAVPVLDVRVECPTAQPAKPAANISPSEIRTIAASAVYVLMERLRRMAKNRSSAGRVPIYRYGRGTLTPAS
jgi:hypothetical protein